MYMLKVILKKRFSFWDVVAIAITLHALKTGHPFIGLEFLLVSSFASSLVEFLIGGGE